MAAILATVSSPVEQAEGGTPAAGTQDRHRWAEASRRLPRPLAILLLLVAVFGISWALIVPPFQAPDETTHFAYAQSLATRLALPGDKHRPLGVSTDESVADAAVGASALAFDVDQLRPDWSRADFESYLAQVRRTPPSQSDGGGPNPEAVNPPLFYLYSDLAYWASGSDNLFGRLYAMRVWGVLLLLVNVVAGWLLAGEIFARRRLSQLICAAVCGLVPTETFISTSVTPDALMVPLWTLALWLGTRLIRRGWRTAEAATLCAVTAAAILTKATSYALVPAVLLALVVAWRAQSKAGHQVGTGRAAGALSALVLPVLGWLALDRALGRSAVNTVSTPAGAHASPFNARQFLSYLWQFYLPRLPFMTTFHESNGLAVDSVWLRQGWATFGWLDVRLSDWIYQLLGALTAGFALLAAAFLVTMRWAGRRMLMIFFTVAGIALLFGLHLTDYRSIIAAEGPLLQGRYLLPIVGLFGLVVSLALVRLPRRWRGPGAGAVLAALLVLQILALATVTQAYYT